MCKSMKIMKVKKNIKENYNYIYNSEKTCNFIGLRQFSDMFEAFPLYCNLRNMSGNLRSTRCNI